MVRVPAAQARGWFRQAELLPIVHHHQRVDCLFPPCGRGGGRFPPEVTSSSGAPGRTSRGIRRAGTTAGRRTPSTRSGLAPPAASALGPVGGGWTVRPCPPARRPCPPA